MLSNLSQDREDKDNWRSEGKKEKKKRRGWLSHLEIISSVSRQRRRESGEKKQN